VVVGEWKKVQADERRRGRKRERAFADSGVVTTCSSEIRFLGGGGESAECTQTKGAQLRQKNQSYQARKKRQESITDALTESLSS